MKRSIEYIVHNAYVYVVTHINMLSLECRNLYKKACYNDLLSFYE